MRLVVLCLVTALTLPSSGCLWLIGEDYQVVCGDGMIDSAEGYETCDDGNDLPGDGCSEVCRVENRLAMTWSFVDIAGGTHGCPAGFDTVEVVATKNQGGDTVRASFPCSDGTATVAIPKNGTYLAYYRVLDSTLQLYATSVAAQATFQENARSLAPAIVIDGGQLGVRWEFVDEATTTSVACADPRSEVRVTATPVGGGTATTAVGACDAFTTLYVPLAAGRYDVTVSGMIGMRTGTATRTDIELRAPNVVTDLGLLSLVTP